VLTTGSDAGSEEIDAKDTIRKTTHPVMSTPIHRDDHSLNE
jgi:hypothetical protein